MTAVERLAMRREEPRTPEPLAPMQRRVLNAIMAHIITWGYPPTIRELGQLRGTTSTNATSDLVAALERKGYIACPEMNASRAITVLRDADGRRVTLQFHTEESTQ